jgi:hypothetical protein
MDKDKVSDRLNKIAKVFDIQKILELKISDKYIQKYYKVNQIAYSIFHTRTDLIYMGVSRDGKYKSSDMLAKPLISHLFFFYKKHKMLYR